ncbi:MAG: dTMP kinase [Gammaproteobacteria bacterium]|nr:MAG: dTMP kinase [Gammaproteobacteria bacterium]
MKKGLFVTVEGGEGAGKSTCLDYVKQLLEQKGINAVFTREPGGTEIGEDVRSILLNKKYLGMSADTELLLMFAARAEHIDKKILPNLSDGKWVISDRFTDATYAYQGAGREIGPERVALIEDWVQGELRPDMTLLLDLPVEVGMERATKRGELDRFEVEQMSFFERVAAIYRQRAQAEPQRFRVVDASKVITEVHEQIKSIFEAKFSELGI